MRPAKQCWGSVAWWTMAMAGIAVAQEYTLQEECAEQFHLSGTLLAENGWNDQTQARLVFNVQPSSDHYYAAIGGKGTQFFKVQDGQEKPLGPAQPLRLAPRVPMTVQRERGRMVLVCGGEVVARASDAEFQGGQWGVALTGKLHFQDLAQQPTEPVYFTDDFMREKAAGEWEFREGVWELSGIRHSGANPNQSANPFGLGGKATAGPAIAVAGYDFWTDYTVKAAVKPDGLGGVGLCAYFQDADNYLLFRWTTLEGNEKQLVCVREGQETLLSPAEGGFISGQWYQLALQIQEGQIAAFIDEELVLESICESFGQGQVGLYVQEGTQAIFDDIRVESGPLGRKKEFGEEPKFNPQFLKDRQMVQWAHLKGQWQQGPDGRWWHPGDFFGDASVAVALPPQWHRGDRLVVILHAQENVPDSGYRLKVQATGPRRLTATLQRQDQTVAQEQWVGKAETEQRLEFRRQDGRLKGQVNQKPLLTFPDEHPLRGRRVGLELDWDGVKPEHAEARSTHLWDETFGAAPTEWWMGKGPWEMLARWSCSPEWSWFGGSGQGPIVWSKRAFTGDLMVEAYVAPRMNFRGEQGGPTYHDLNLTICGDGRDLGSGYSFIFAGWNNQKTALLRRSEIVAETTASQFLIQKGNGPHSGHWFHLRAQKKGTHLRFYVDDVLALGYEDPEPFPGGRIAFWTWGNGMLLTRVRVWYEDEGVTGPLLAPPPGRWAGQRVSLPQQFPEPILGADFEEGLDGWSDRQQPEGAVIQLDSTTASHGQQSLKITNATSGGDFTVWTGATEFDLQETPLLSFDYQVPLEVKVNVYFKWNGQWCGVVFTGTGEPDGEVLMLGQIPDVRADNKWHHAEFDLLAALPEEDLPGPLKAQDLVFSSPLEPYLRCGFGGNPYGVTYHLDHFELQPRPGSPQPIPPIGDREEGGV